MFVSDFVFIPTELCMMFVLSYETKYASGTQLIPSESSSRWFWLLFFFFFNFSCVLFPPTATHQSLLLIPLKPLAGMLFTLKLRSLV